MSRTTQFTILVPTFNHEKTLRYSLASIQDQTISDFSVEIIGDGSGERTAKIAEEFVAKDSRFTFHQFPKSPRTGEPYRDKIIANTKSAYICYLSDDDLWFPDHLENMRKILNTADFAYSFPIMIRPDGSVGVWYGDFSQQFYKQLFLSPRNKRYNFVPLSCASHKRSAYNHLSRGWETTPSGKHTDLHMWQEFVRSENVKVEKTWTPTVLHFASSQRRTDNQKKRLRELENWHDRMKNDPLLRQNVLTGALETTYNDFLHFRAAIHSTKTWRLHDFLETVWNKIRI